MSSNDSYTVINRSLEERRNINTGRTRRVIRASVSIEADPIFVLTDPKALGQPVADAIAHHFRERIRGITQQASAATIKARQVAARAAAKGRAWANRRYGGGRLGKMPPNQSDRLFNDSGRFAAGIVASASRDNSWRINVAANRLSDATAGPDGVQRIWERLIQLIPEFDNIGLVFETNTIVRKMIERISNDRITVGKRPKFGATQFSAFAETFFGGG